jgi:hypothetical protein
MRNAVVSRDAVAQAAGQLLFAEGGTAVDAVLAAMLAGAARASEASLLGSGGVLVAGTGTGAHFVDGRARAPGLGERRGRTPDPAPDTWTAAVPRLLEAVLAAHARFGALPLSVVVRAATTALREGDVDAPLRARLRFLEQLHRTGHSALERMGVLRGVMNVAGPIAGGVFTRDDLAAKPAPVRALAACIDGDDAVLVPPRRTGRYGKDLPDPLPAVSTEGAIAMDMHGVTAVAMWTVCPTAASLPEVAGLALPALMPRPRKGVPRWRPGEALPLPLPGAVLLRADKAWGAVVLSGHGDLVATRDEVVSQRLATGGVAITLGDEARGDTARDVMIHWALRDADGESVRLVVSAG